MEVTDHPGGRDAAGGAGGTGGIDAGCIARSVPFYHRRSAKRTRIEPIDMGLGASRGDSKEGLRGR